MTIVLAQDPTGPSLFDHEVFQVGALFCPDDLSSVRQEFACYIAPSRPEQTDVEYVSRQSIRSVAELKNRSEYWGEPETVWPHFVSVAEKASSGNGVRIFCFDASRDAPFLRKALKRTGAIDEEITRSVGGLVQATVDISARDAYAGKMTQAMKTLRAAGPYDRDQVCEAVFGAHGVECSRLSDAKKRAEAIRQSYRSIFIDLQKTQSTSNQSVPANGPYRQSGSSPTVRGR